LDLITPDPIRRDLLDKYNKFKSDSALSEILKKEEEIGYKENYSIEQINTRKNRIILEHYPSFRELLEIYPSFFLEDNNLKNFLDSGAVKKLREIDIMDEYRRALDTTQVKSSKSISSNSFYDFFPKTVQAYSFDDIIDSANKWSDRFNQHQKLSPYEIYSFENEFFPRVHLWLNTLDRKSDSFFDPINSFMSDLYSEIDILKKVDTHAFPFEEKEGIILNKQKKIAEILHKIAANFDYLISLETYESQKCHIRYGRNNLKIRMWIFSLICMSWTLINLTNKVKDGHCNNIDHEHGDQKPRECFDGRKFHYSIYQKCIKSFYDSLAVIEKDLDKYRF